MRIQPSLNLIVVKMASGVVALHEVFLRTQGLGLSGWFFVARFLRRGKVYHWSSPDIAKAGVGRALANRAPHGRGPLMGRDPTRPREMREEKQ